MKYDTIIIGAGFTDTAAAALLSKKQKVLVVDKNISPFKKECFLDLKDYWLQHM